MKSPIVCACLVMWIMATLPGTAPADTVYLKNGGVAKGVIVKEGKCSVELDVGFGSITCAKNQIQKIERSSSDEKNALRQQWDAERKELEADATEYADAREQRFLVKKQLIEEELKKRAPAPEPGHEIKASRSEESRHVLTEVLLNDKVKAMLVLDTGASLVLLSKRIGEALGVDLSDTKKNMMTVQVAGGKTVLAKSVILDKVRVQDVEVEKVLAAILIEDTKSSSFRDGLLGMTFLSRFNIKIDQKNMKVILEKIKQ